MSVLDKDILEKYNDDVDNFSKIGYQSIIQIILKHLQCVKWEAVHSMVPWFSCTCMQK